ncbi:MAG: hypothetical protein WC878_03280 [Candidatus Paceibacterota bacterium]|jgi:hypothetical protein
MKKSKKIFLITGLFVFAALGFMFVSGGNSLAQENQISVETASGASNETGEQILALLEELTRVELDVSIFDDPVFQSLKDYHVDLTEEPKQRDNPFAPIGQDVIIEETQGTPTTVPSNPRTPKSPVGE